MATANLFTFTSLFSESANGEAPLVTGIEIPRIQRDYAQGRDTPDVCRIRKRFLESLHKALTEGPDIKLDFVYGNIDGGKLVPLDGQQRLTTLFLLHWYVAKHEIISAERAHCLTRFTYRTRRSARTFCQYLAAFAPDFSHSEISAEITDQAWMPLDWRNDPTIRAMLRMIDDIHQMFRDTSGLWDRLEQGVISFYFLPLKDMSMSADELYVKMNSRGKPLTEFEHFKAEWERAIAQKDEATGKRISRKIDTDWTDMLWPYRGDNEIIDDEFVRYFSYLCALIFYKRYPEEAIPDDIFDVVQKLFVEKENDEALANIAFIESGFDCWCGHGDNDSDISAFFDRYLSDKEEHEEGKSLVDKGKGTDIFLDCCNHFGIMQNTLARKFPVGRMLLLYAFILFRQNRPTVSDAQWIRRLRVVNNLIRNSDDELREERMKSLLTQTEEIVLHGNIDLHEADKEFKGFNIEQTKEEIEKQQWLTANEALAPTLFRLENHPLLQGAIRVIGLDNLPMCDKFYALFKCNRILISRAMLTLGDYSAPVTWRYQIGSEYNSSWNRLFHQPKDKNEVCRDILLRLLNMADPITNEALQKIIDDYLATCTTYDWRYYIIKYPAMQPDTFGMYYFYDEKTHDKKRYWILKMQTEKHLGGRNHNIFLKTIFETSGITSGLSLSEYAHGEDGGKLRLDEKGLYIICADSAYEVHEVHKRPDAATGKDATTDTLIHTMPIPQKDGIDTEDRIPIGIALLKELMGAE